MRRVLLLYFLTTGILFHVAAAAIIYSKPDLASRTWYSAYDWLARKMPSILASDAQLARSIDIDLETAFSSWQPLASDHSVPDGQARIGKKTYASPLQASKELYDGATLLIGAGHYKQALIIAANNVTIEGVGNVHFSHAQALGKGNLVVTGSDVLIRNIECSEIRVPHQNGSCIRHEGKNLTVEHVYLHDSQQGILTGPNPGLVMIRDSRFQRLGNQGQAHGVYIGGGRLFIDNSIFLASKSAGHEIKSRAAATLIMNSVIASLNGRDSRLIDIADGGDFSLLHSVLEQGPNSLNSDVIGYALERGAVHGKVTIKNNIFILERVGTNTLLHANRPIAELSFSGNIIVSSERQNSHETPLSGRYFKDRKSAGLAAYPALPSIDK